MSKKKTTDDGLRMPAPVSVTKLEDLAGLSVVKAKVLVSDGRVLEFTGRRLRPRETKEISLLLEGALPPLLPIKEGEEPRYDFDSPDYKRRKLENLRQARALALWWAFPLFQQWAGSSSDWEAKRIAEFIEGLDLDNDLLDVLFAKLTERRISIPEAVGFTSGSNSPTS